MHRNIFAKDCGHATTIEHSSGVGLQDLPLADDRFTTSAVPPRSVSSIVMGCARDATSFIAAMLETPPAPGGGGTYRAGFHSGLPPELPAATSP